MLPDDLCNVRTTICTCPTDAEGREEQLDLDMPSALTRLLLPISRQAVRDRDAIYFYGGFVSGWDFGLVWCKGTANLKRHRAPIACKPGDLDP